MSRILMALLIVLIASVSSAREIHCFPAFDYIANKASYGRVSLTVPDMGVGESSATVWKPAFKKFAPKARLSGSAYIYAQGDEFYLELVPESVYRVQSGVNIFYGFLRGKGLTDSQGENLACF